MPKPLPFVLELHYGDDAARPRPYEHLGTEDTARRDALRLLQWDTAAAFCIILGGEMEKPVVVDSPAMADA